MPEGAISGEILQLTQSNLSPGNCYQTAVACVLCVPAEELPDQVLIEQADGAYGNALRAYLLTHHRVSLASLYDWQIGGLMPRAPGLHLIQGKTVRTATNGGREHVIVGKYGEPLWDPHPSRAGLTEVTEWLVFSPAPASWLTPEARAKSARIGCWPSVCLCPACGGFKPNPHPPAPKAP
jgi:hypothetical protein